MLLCCCSGLAGQSVSYFAEWLMVIMMMMMMMITVMIMVMIMIIITMLIMVMMIKRRVDDCCSAFQSLRALYKVLIIAV